MPTDNAQGPGADRAKEPIVKVRSLAFSHGAQSVLKGFDLELFPGRHYILAGPNGAGKSTLLDLLSRLKKPLQGNIEVMGKDIGAYPAADFAKVLSLAPQSFNFNFSFTVREIVSLGRRPYLGRWGRMTENDNRIVDRAISFLNLTHLSGKLVTALSGGETQRVVLARTLAQDTPIVLLDEPTASLDVAQAIDLMERVRALVAGGTLVVTVTHDLHLAAVYADDMIFLKKGNLIAAGKLIDTLTAPVLREVFDADAKVS
ncbi:MAG: ABC transporter ATP-binding protein, partial [Deltaproteobacteria bacterium]|nr:ABC transporter ATP-binding protein [Deltaproteobacteria bacterium]